MIDVPIAAVPNQSFSIQLDNVSYDMAIYSTGNVMSMDIIRAGTPILLGERLVPNYPIIPYRYLESGNFVFITLDGDYPTYDQFGVTQNLIYLSATELASLRAGL